MSFDFEHQEDIHAERRIAPERDLLFVALLVLTFILEYEAVLDVMYSQFALAALLHWICIALMFSYARLKDRKGKDARFAWMTVIFLPLLGPFAPAGILLSVFWHFISKEKSLTFRQWSESIFPPIHQSLAEIVYERITFGRDQSGENYSVTALLDVIRMGSDEKKREAIFKISRHYDPSFAPLLKFALEDPHNVIRVQAATAIAKIKNGFFSQTLKLEKYRQDCPHIYHLLFELAKHYDNYAFSGLLDETQEEENRWLALQYYDEFIRKEKEATAKLLEARQLLARLLLRMNRIEEACLQFEKLREDKVHTPDINLWYSECLFHLKRYGALRNLAAEDTSLPLIADIVKYPYHIRGTIMLWAGRTQEAPHVQE